MNETYLARLPMLLSLEAEYDSPDWWWEQRRQAIHTMWVNPMFNEKDDLTGIYCDPDAANYWPEDCDCAAPELRMDWRPGLEMSDEETRRWALLDMGARYYHHTHYPHLDTKVKERRAPVQATRRTGYTADLYIRDEAVTHPHNDIPGGSPTDRFCASLEADGYAILEPVGRGSDRGRPEGEEAS